MRIKLQLNRIAKVKHDLDLATGYLKMYGMQTVSAETCRKIISPDNEGFLPCTPSVNQTEDFW